MKSLLSDSFIAEQSIFLDVVGDSPTMRVLQYLIEGRDFDYTLTDLTNAGVSWGTLHTIFPKLLKYKIVMQTRAIGRAKLYKINKENPAAKKFIDLYDTLITESFMVRTEKKAVIV